GIGVVCEGYREEGRLSTVAVMSDLGWVMEERRGRGVASCGHQWLWQPDPGGGYFVRGAYDMLTFREGQDVDATTDLIWHKQVPLKVSVVA
ncbi:cysteine-rich receptor-like protein kinase, partial [Trifolium medium]|nr:cysteine-rich receptor-like protein kinase [Trifolium medium]